MKLRCLKYFFGITWDFSFRFVSLFHWPIARFDAIKFSILNNKLFPIISKRRFSRIPWNRDQFEINVILSNAWFPTQRLAGLFWRRWRKSNLIQLITFLQGRTFKWNQLDCSSKTQSIRSRKLILNYKWDLMPICAVAKWHQKWIAHQMKNNTLYDGSDTPCHAPQWCLILIIFILNIKQWTQNMNNNISRYHDSNFKLFTYFWEIEINNESSLPFPFPFPLSVSHSLNFH